MSSICGIFRDLRYETVYEDVIDIAMAYILAVPVDAQWIIWVVILNVVFRFLYKTSLATLD